MRLLRQTRFGIFDLSLHLGTRSSALRLWQQIAARYPFPPVRSDNRFPHVFSHIFDRSYAAGYYSYLWSETYSNLIFQRGSTQPAFRQLFAQKVLTRGGERASSEVYAELLPGKPSVGPLLASYGISPKKPA